MSTTCGRPQVRGGGSGPRGHGAGGQKPDFFGDIINGWPFTPVLNSVTPVLNASVLSINLQPLQSYTSSISCTHDDNHQGFQAHTVVNKGGASIPPKPMMHIAYCPLFPKNV